MSYLFGRNKLKATAAQVATDDILPFIQIVQSWHHDYYHGTLKTDKETSREQAYNQDFFKTILGYKEKPATPFTLEPKATTGKGQLPDAVLSHNGDNIAAVVELKGAAISLDKPQQREGNMSPVQQAFKYKTQYRRCPFVIVSNFYEFRLYQDNQLDYESWTLDDLINPTNDYENFKSWYVLLRSDNFITESGSSKTEGLLSEVRINQEQIGKAFYSHYKEARLGLLRDLYQHNKSVRADINFGIEKAQKIIDRIVFVCFAEDRGLLPDNILHQVIESSKTNVFGGSLWNALRGFFDAIDRGSTKLEIPNGYNGGLFKTDNDLNTLEISDQALEAVTALGGYNFTEDLSVTILGHIFEQSISDLEEIRAKADETGELGAATQSRRKKDGIFYTPDYIVRYIVDNSLGAYLREAEEKFKAEFGLKGDITDKNYAKREQQAYAKYQDFLQNIKVVDPACGSGAFLVYVFDYLLAENQRVGDILGGTLFSSDDYVRDILRNNIYGVDLNEESVEITKLSLWLKTAQKGKKLTALDANIRCGNSLIDDPEIAGKKAFNWQTEFKDIFAQGGFDVVVGNPPYGADIDSILQYFIEHYRETASGHKDTYKFFIQKAVEILVDNGALGFIVPNSYLYQPKYHDLKEYVDRQSYFVLNIGEKIFDNVEIPTCITILRKRTGGHEFTKDMTKISRANIADELASVNLAREKRIAKSISGISKIAGFTVDNVFYLKDAGIQYHRNKIGLRNKGGNDLRERIFETGSESKFSRTKETYYGALMERYYIANKTDERFNLDYKNVLNSNESVSFSEDSFNIPEKLIWRQTSDRIRATLDTKKRWFRNTIQCAYLQNEFINKVDMLYALAVFNSQYFVRLYQQKSLESGRVFPQVKLGYIRDLPFIVDIDQKPLAKLADEMLHLNADFVDKNNHFAELLSTEFEFKKLPTNWWNLDFANFVTALKTKLTLSQRDDLLELWNKYQPRLATLSAEIKSLDRQIDQLVYKLYNLTDVEIKIIEGSK